MDINNDSEKGEKGSLKAFTSDSGARGQRGVWDKSGNPPYQGARSDV